MPVTLIKRLKNCENHNLGIELQKTKVTLTFKLLLTLYHRIPTLNDHGQKNPLKTLLEKEKMLVTSILLFP